MSAGRLLTIAAAAVRLDITARTLRSWIAAGHLTVLRLSPRCVRIEERELERFIASRRAEASR